MNEKNPNLIRDELESLDAVKKRLATAGATWNNVVIQHVDLQSVDEPLSKVAIGGCQFLGCIIGTALAGAIATAIAEGIKQKEPKLNCLVFPDNPALKFKPFRSTLYSATELVGDFSAGDPKKIYETSVDWLSYLTFADPKDTKPFTNDSVDTILSRRLHDTSIADALDDLLAPIREGKGYHKGIVAIMGGHDMKRQEKTPHAESSDPLGEEEWEALADDTVYTRVAFLSWKLTRDGYLLVSGGGPGAMEATNLGAYFATRTLSDLRAAIRKLQDFPEFKSGKSVEWLIPAMAVLKAYPLPADDERKKCESVGIPTWMYGHEPPNPFATHIAKYFENSVREEGLLAIATHGVIFAEGNAGTVQEIFQDACQNYYATYGTAAPMILFGKDYWDPPVMPVYVNDKRKKAFPLVRKLAEEKGFTHRLFVSDSLREIQRIITGYRP